MNASNSLVAVWTPFGGYLLHVAAAIGILIIGWIVAALARAGVRKLLSALKVDERITESAGQGAFVETLIANGLFWFILLVTAVAIFNVLDLTDVSSPLSQLLAQIVGYLPNLVAGTALTLVAWLVALVLRSLASRALRATRFDERLSDSANIKPASSYLSNLLFWLVILMFLPAILSAFALLGLLGPVQLMMNRLLGIVPNLFAAAVIGCVGWVLARVLRGLVMNLLVAAGVDGIPKAVGMPTAIKPSRLAASLVYLVVLVPTLIAALDALQIETISRPATDMLGRFFDAVPDIVAAIIILLVTFYVARFAASLIRSVLVAAGADGLPAVLGVGRVFTGMLLPSTLASRLIVFFSMLFAVVEASNRLGFTQVRDIVTLFIEFGGHVLMGAIILVIGYWLADLARRVIQQAESGHSVLFARIAQFAILGLVFAMGLRAMGIANEIVQLAFGLVLGAIAVAVALAFGLGGRTAAGRLLERWLDDRTTDR
jgi:hypothetical protein